MELIKELYDQRGKMDSNIFSAVALLAVPIGAVRLEFREAGSLAVHPLWKELKFVSGSGTQSVSVSSNRKEVQQSANTNKTIYSGIPSNKTQ